MRLCRSEKTQFGNELKNSINAGRYTVDYLQLWESAVSGMENAHNCAPKLQVYPPIFSLTPKASGST